MGHPLISPDIFASEPKSKYDSASLDSAEYVIPDGGEGYASTIQLYGSYVQPHDQPWRLQVRDWLVFICIVILAAMDAYNSTILITVLPVRRTQ